MERWTLHQINVLQLEVKYALDNYGYFVGPVVAGVARRCRRRVDSSVACDCRDSVDHQLDQWPKEYRLGKEMQSFYYG